MKTIFTIVGCAFAFFSNLSNAAEGISISSLDFMTGCWVKVEGDTRYEERFTKPTNNMMLGVSQFVKAGTTEFYEFLPIIQRGDKIVYVPYINGSQSVDFTLASASSSEAVFVNPGHDYPQKIIYSKPSETQLVARIEGLQNGQQQSEEFRMNRANCNQ
jgi:hypothetical protein